MIDRDERGALSNHETQDFYHTLPADDGSVVVFTDSKQNSDSRTTLSAEATSSSCDLSDAFMSVASGSNNGSGFFGVARMGLAETELESNVVLRSPPADGIHEGQVSLTHGFVPYQPISRSLPLQYREWEALADNLPQMISEGSERVHIARLPLLDASDERYLPNEYLSRAIAMIGNFAHAYYYNQRLGVDQASDPLPMSVLTPWEQLTKRIQRKMPADPSATIGAVRIHYDTFLTNWSLSNTARVIDGISNAQIRLRDLAILSPIFDNAAEYNFNMTFVIMELRFARALFYISESIKAVAEEDDDALIFALQQVSHSIEDVTLGLDYINPNPHSEHHVDPTVWTKTVAKIDGKIPGGTSGLSGSAMPLFHAMDIFIERRDYASTMGKAMGVKYLNQPEQVKRYLSALRHDLERHSIRQYVERSSNPILRSQYDLLIAAYLGEQGLLGVHALKVYGYMKINFRNGRLLTNGGHDGTSTIATEPQRHIYDDFAMADSERWGDYTPRQQYATKISMRVYPGKAASIVLDVTGTALRFQPGDHCAIQSENTTDDVSALLKHYGLSPDVLMGLNSTWRKFFQRHLGFSAESIALSEILKHADLSAQPKIGDVLSIDELQPIKPRYYSVSFQSHFPKRIGLTVGMHSASDGRRPGLTSNYLINSDGQRPIAIDRIPARHFHLPTVKDTPILMFAAGTGISPFIGFIAERGRYSDRTKNFLFLSTASLETFYYQEELEHAVKNGQLDLSVIFSRGGAEYDSLEFDATGFSPRNKYAGKHVDQLINEQARIIVDLIVHHEAQVYICGSPGFSETVRTSIIRALQGYSGLANASGYIDTMIADFRFNADVYSPTDHTVPYRAIYPSEVAIHNKSDDCWGIINGGVYDLTRLLQTHPGGQKIIGVNAGIDMSSDYNYIKHNQQPQIEAMLQQYKIGVVARPLLEGTKTIELYEKSKKFLEAIVEMENTLRNNTTYGRERDEAYLWREVYGVFVDGSLASYRKMGSGNAGSLNYVLGTLLNGVCVVSDFPMGRAEASYAELMRNASQCADYLRSSSIGPLSSTERLSRKAVFDIVMQQTFQFIEQLKKQMLHILSDIENKGDGYRQEIVSESLDVLIQSITAYSAMLKHMVTHLPKLERTAPAPFEEGAVGCVFARHAQGGVCPAGSGAAIGRFGFIADRARPIGGAFLPSVGRVVAEAELDVPARVATLSQASSAPAPNPSVLTQMLGCSVM